ncbi:tetraketide alpha-pyrone reductase 1 [Dorcoceras hygrometricum]|uniref:Tetraketide alpha-pyrone reductase 1 n=1 Tax=Dorcoceras hygrometricum TaxID=472368 RepID=A0A2Z7BAZ6_9LAMI|nr:tetraketide alpha-pyrone reductase 1 [Dorcoceras hygrometricum]
MSKLEHASSRDEKYRFLVKSTLVKVTVAPAGGIGISRYGDISVTHEDLLALVRIEVAAGRHRARDAFLTAGSVCVVLVAADQQRSAVGSFAYVYEMTSFLLISRCAYARALRSGVV